ncbi:L-threonine ammonia-lyase [Hasllibacter halocynthiae]|uniref:L-threonine dehydratase n=1 Tax=Hasllibacter halocynthiae TaxID=595589 RepID=A0A2T0X273_9RHOB|nr:threonine ammonia-lyase IlvA [Hasllibacter halocynthiae]PRY93053.1 L-threonine ammonia-lyase [Hasllibacter halocynthiae]
MTAPAAAPPAVRDALAAIRTLFPPTPCQRNAFLSDRLGAEVWLKREDLTPVRSYKIRGAFNAMRGSGAPVVCASAGNHAQGVAWCCARLKVRGEVFMPVTTPEQKRMKTAQFGGEWVTIRLVGDTFDECLAAALDNAAGTDARFLSPFDDDAVIAGQATVAAEIAEAVPGADVLVMPVGGGGLSAGARLLFGDGGPELRLAEPETAASLKAALAAGAPVDIGKVPNFVDGAAVARIGARPFALLRGMDPAAVVTVPEDRLCGTIQEMLNVEGIVLEPAGALAVDAVEHMGDLAGRTVVAVCTGGNFDFERLPEVRERAARFAGLKRYWILSLPQRPGALRGFLDLLGPNDNITRFEYLKKSARTVGTVLIGIESASPAELLALDARVQAEGLSFRDITDDPVMVEFVI